ncbi:glutathione S-transferase [Serendipita vermifera]|nr:glutathione S-transferase [Serendipita vermifera]
MPLTDPVSKDLVFYTAATANGKKVSVFLEELKSAYGVDYSVEKIDLYKSVQKEPWFIAINPNGRIPALVDNTNKGFKYDKDRKFSFEPGSDDESEMLQWIFFTHGGIGPMQGQLNWFTKLAPEKIPYAIERYLNETKRLYSVLEIRLKDRDYLAGPDRGTYSLADMNCFPWVNGHGYSGIESLDPWPGVKAWTERLKARPQLLAGLAVPS